MKRVRYLLTQLSPTIALTFNRTLALPSLSHSLSHSLSLPLPQDWALQRSAAIMLDGTQRVLT